MNPISGELCIREPLDHEKRSTYEFPVVATDRGRSFFITFLPVILHLDSLFLLFLLSVCVTLDIRRIK